MSPTPPARRADWLHLLPTPEAGWQRLVVLGADEATRSLVAAAGLANSVAFHVDDVPTADALVVFHDADAVPTHVARCPDVRAVLVVDRRRGPQRARLEQQLVAAGLDAIERYWPVPDWERPRRHVPIDHAGALRWYLTHLLVETTPAARLLRAVLPMVAHRAPGLLLAALPSVVSVAARGPARTGRSLVLTSGNDRWSRAVSCEFPEGASAPTVVEKAPTERAGNDTVLGEQRTLYALRDDLSPAMRATVPEPLGYVARGAVVVGRETAVPGTALSAQAGRGDPGAAIAALDAAAAWAGRLHEETATTMPWDPARLDDWLRAPAERRHERRGPDPRLDRLVDAVCAEAGSLAGTGASVAYGWTHHDLGPWNVVWRPDGVGVVDWEAAEPPAPERTPPHTDLVYLANYWLHVAGGFHDPVAHRAAARRLWTDVRASDDLVLAARRVVGRPVVDGDTPAPLLAVAIVHTWLDQANRIAARRADLGAATDDSHPDSVLAVLADDPDGLLAVAAAITAG